MGKTDKAGAVLLFVVVILALVFGIMRNDDEGGDESKNKNREVADNGDDKRAKRADLNGLRKKAAGNRGGNRKRPGGKKVDPKVGPKPKPGPGKKPGPGAGGGKRPGSKPVVPPVPPRDEPKPAPKGEWPKKHAVASGEVLGAICAKYYGTTRMVSRVLDANPGLDPKRMLAGDEIVLPAPPADLVAGGGSRKSGEKPASAPIGRPSFISSEYLRRNGAAAGGGAAGRDVPTGSRTYTVKSGDILSKIAQRELGSSKHVGRLIEANKDLIKNPDKLREGWVLVLPNVN